MARTRTWLAAYPVDGLIGLLEEGLQSEGSEPDGSWFQEQLSRLRTRQGVHP
jgi:hypothetical protein